MELNSREVQLQKYERPKYSCKERLEQTGYVSRQRCLIRNRVVICACVLYNKMALYMHSTQKYSLKNWRLGEATIFFKLCYRALCARKGADLCVNES